MKIVIEADSQDEFDLKRDDLLHKIAGCCYELDLTKSLRPRRAVIGAQNEIMDHFDDLFNRTVADIKADIEQILEA